MAQDTLNYYSTLEVAPGATEAEIRSAFRKLARRYHPDINPDPSAPERFRTVVSAYEVLSDPARRAEYDAQRSRPAGRAGRGSAGGPSWRPAAGSTRGPSGAGGVGRARGERAAAAATMPPVRGLDRHATLRVPAEALGVGGSVPAGQKEAAGNAAAEAKTPSTVQTGVLNHRRWERCTRCEGFGRLKEPVPCDACGGEGFRNGHISDPCKVCWTTGTTTICPTCTGRGSLWQSKRIEVTIPPGARYGQQLRLRGMGDAGPRSGPPGDLYVEIAPPLPAAVQAVTSNELVQAALRRLEEWLDRFAPYPT